MRMSEEKDLKKFESESVKKVLAMISEISGIIVSETSGSNPMEKINMGSTQKISKENSKVMLSEIATMMKSLSPVHLERLEAIDTTLQIERLCDETGIPFDRMFPADSVISSFKSLNRHADRFNCQTISLSDLCDRMCQSDLRKYDVTVGECLMFLKALTPFV